MSIQELKLALDPVAKLPTRNSVDEYKKTMLPDSLEVEINFTRAHIDDVVIQTVVAIIQDEIKVNDYQFLPPSKSCF